MSLPLHYYRTQASEAEIRARLTVLYDKSWRIKAYNSHRDPQTLDGKQRGIMAAYGCKLGRDQMPHPVSKALKMTIRVLETRLDELVLDRITKVAA